MLAGAAKEEASYDEESSKVIVIMLAAIIPGGVGTLLMLPSLAQELRANNLEFMMQYCRYVDGVKVVDLSNLIINLNIMRPSLQ